MLSLFEQPPSFPSFAARFCKPFQQPGEVTLRRIFTVIFKTSLLHATIWQSLGVVQDLNQEHLGKYSPDLFPSLLYQTIKYHFVGANERGIDTSLYKNIFSSNSTSQYCVTLSKNPRSAKSPLYSGQTSSLISLQTSPTLPKDLYKLSGRIGDSTA